MGKGSAKRKERCKSKAGRAKGEDSFNAKRKVKIKRKDHAIITLPSGKERRGFKVRIRQEGPHPKQRHSNQRKLVIEADQGKVYRVESLA